MKNFRLSKWKTDRRALFGLLLTLAVLLAACGGSGGGGGGGGGSGGTGTGVCANDYYPIVNGATWTYSGTGVTGAFTSISTITDVSGTNFTLTNQFGELTATQQWSCTPEGLVALEYTGGPESTLSTGSGLSGTFQTTDVTGVTYPPHISAGDTWTQTYTIHGDMSVTEGQTATADGTVSQDYTAVGTESVTVPAGTFEAMKLEVTLHFDMVIAMGTGITLPMAFDLESTNWLVPGIGWVKSDATTTGAGGEISHSTSELLSYSIP
jgi:hypothetical protein